MTKITLPYLDHDGTLSPLVQQAIEEGAIADRDASHVADEIFVLIFKTKKAADAFSAKIVPATVPIETPEAE